MMHAWAICRNLWLLFFAGWILAGLWTKPSAQRVDFGRQMSYAVPVLLGFTLLFSKGISLTWFNLRLLPPSEAADISGIAMTVAGMAFAIWARVHLGRNWSSAPTIKQGHQLIQTGPYRLVRHPIYTGFLLSAIGTFLVNPRIRGLLGVLLLYVAFVIKSRIEEEFMVRTFGEKYVSYRQTTGVIIPRSLS